MHSCCAGFLLLTSLRPGFYPSPEDRNGNTVCNEGGSTKSMRSSANFFKPLTDILAWLLYPPLLLAYWLHCHLQLQRSQISELDSERTTTTHVVSLLGNPLQKSKGKERVQVRFSCCLGFTAFPERALKQSLPVGAPMFNCNSQHSSLVQKENHAKLLHIFFPVEPFPCLLALWAAIIKVWATAPLASSLCSSTLLLLVARSVKPTVLLSPPQPESVGHW